MADDKLIERRRRSDENGAGAPTAASGASRALPGGGDGSGIAGHHHGVERADVDAKFHGGSGDYAADAAFAEAMFDFTPLVGQVAPAIAADRFGLPELLRIGLLQIGEN